MRRGIEYHTAQNKLQQCYRIASESIMGAVLKKVVSCRRFFNECLTVHCDSICIFEEERKSPLKKPYINHGSRFVSSNS